MFLLITLAHLVYYVGAVVAVLVALLCLVLLTGSLWRWVLHLQGTEPYAPDTTPWSVARFMMLCATIFLCVAALAFFTFRFLLINDPIVMWGATGWLVSGLLLQTLLRCMDPLGLSGWWHYATDEEWVLLFFGALKGPLLIPAVLYGAKEELRLEFSSHPGKEN